ncbi:MAG: HAMP domain-containing histidine kinase [Bacteroidetes bacterium]|nr:HAMP domain-containing histidine kinase [Bacteroidota bacterium]
MEKLHKEKTYRLIMIAGEGTVFLLLLLYGLYKIRLAHKNELALNKQQQNFLMSITHELKTPLTAIQLQLQTIKKHKLDFEKQTQLVNAALIESQRLNTLIANLLLATKAEATNEWLNKIEIDFSQLLEKTIKQYYSDFISKNKITLLIQPNGHIKGDEFYLISVITNLIDNAIKYSFNEISIVVELFKKENQLLFTIKDFGVGIKDENKQKVFEKFYREGNEDTRKTKGTGLGLFIVKHIIKQHGALITIKNNQPKGTIVEINFNAV